MTQPATHSKQNTNQKAIKGGNLRIKLCTSIAIKNTAENAEVEGLN